MANDSRTLEIDVTLDNKKLKKGIKDTEKELKGFKGVATSIGPVIAGAFGTAAVVGFASKVAETTAEFERLEAMLKVSIGTAEGASRQFTKLQKFATETPFTVNQVTEAFIKLKNLGLDPSEEALRSYGNTASAMGKDVMQFIEAVADASVNEFERLKEFGIKASQEGDKVKFTFQGVTTEVKKSSNDIQAFLKDIGENQFGGAMAEQMDTINGATSNAGVAIDILSATIGEKLAPAMKGAANATAELAEELTHLIDPTTDSTVREITKEIRKLEASIEDSKEAWFGGAADIAIYQQRIRDLKAELVELDPRQFSQRIEAGTATLGAATVGGGGAAAITGGPAAAGASIGEGGVTESPAVLAAQNEAAMLFQIKADSLASIFGLEQQYSAADLENMKKTEEGRAQLLQIRQQAAGNMLQNLSSLADGESKKGFKIAQAAAIAETSINTIKSAQGAFSALSGIPIVGPALGAIAAAAAIAAGVKNVQKIKSQKFGGGSGKAATPTVPAQGGAGANFGTTPIAQPQQNVPTAQEPPQIKVIGGNTLIGKIVEEEVIPAINDSLRRGVSLDLEFA